MNDSYAPLTPASLPTRLAQLQVMTDRLGPSSRWTVREVGDGNLNLVFIVEGPEGSAVVKQALPYVRAAGESWPLSLERAWFESQALIRLQARDPGRVPQLWHFDPAQALQVMEHLRPHVILRRQLIAQRRFPLLARQLGTFLARTLFRGSELSLPTVERKADLALFAGNVELTGITEDLVFTDPYRECARNRSNPLLADEVRRTRADAPLKQASLELKIRFCTLGESLLHGDLHTGSVMVSEDDTRVIDAEFATCGPMGFDIGALLGNLWMACFAQRSRPASDGADGSQLNWLLDCAQQVWNSFAAEFTVLWQCERHGILGGRELFDAQGDTVTTDRLLQDWLVRILEDSLGYAGIEITRRILGFAHVADFDSIADPAVRADCERCALRAGRELAVRRREIRTMAEATTLIAGLAASPR